MANDPVLSPDDFPEHLAIAVGPDETFGDDADERTREGLGAWLRERLGLPEDATASHAAMLRTAPGTKPPTLTVRFRVVGVKKRSGHDGVELSVGVFDDAGATWLWSEDLDLERPGRPYHLGFRDPGGYFDGLLDARAKLKAYLPGRAAKAGTAAGPAKATKAAPAPRPRLTTEGRPWALAFSPDGAVLASVAQGNVLDLWDAGTGALNASAKVGGRGMKFATALAFSPDGARLASGSSKIFVVDPRTGAELARLPGHKGELKDLAFSPDGRRLVSLGDGRVVVWDLASGEAVWKAPFNEPEHVAFGGEGAVVVSGWGGLQRLEIGITPPTFQGSADLGPFQRTTEGWLLAAFEVRDPATLEPTRRFQVEGVGRDAVFAVDPAGRLLVAGTRNGPTAVLADPATGAVRAVVPAPALPGVTAPELSAVAVTADGGRVALAASRGIAIHDGTGALLVGPGA